MRCRRKTAYLAGLKNTIEVGEDVLANVMIARVDKEDDVDDAEQRQQHNCRSHRFPDNTTSHSHLSRPSLSMDRQR